MLDKHLEKLDGELKEIPVEDPLPKETDEKLREIL